MEKVKFPLSETEQEVLNEARQQEINASSFYNYLSFCFNNYGAENSGDWAYRESQDERRHFKKLSDYLMTRGYEPEMPSIAEPKIDFTDMKSGFKAALQKECDLAEMYEEWFDMLDKEKKTNTTKQLLLEMLSIQLSAIDELRRIELQVTDLIEKEDQLEWDKMYFGPKNETIA